MQSGLCSVRIRSSYYSFVLILTLGNVGNIMLLTKSQYKELNEKFVAFTKMKHCKMFYFKLYTEQFLNKIHYFSLKQV